MCRCWCVAEYTRQGALGSEQFAQNAVFTKRLTAQYNKLNISIPHCECARKRSSPFRRFWKRAIRSERGV